MTDISTTRRGGRQNAIVTYETLANIERSCVRTETMIESIKETQDAQKLEGDMRWRDHETRMRMLEVGTMKSEDILKLTTANSDRITHLEKENRQAEGMKLGISKTTALFWGAGVVVVGQLGNIVTFIKNHI